MVSILSFCGLVDFFHGFVTFFVEDAVRLVTGSSNADVIYNTALYLRISFPLIPTMAVIIILRNMLQGMNHLMMPLVCSSLELIGKVILLSGSCRHMGILQCAFANRSHGWSAVFLF